MQARKRADHEYALFSWGRGERVDVNFPPRCFEAFVLRASVERFTWHRTCVTNSASRGTPVRSVDGSHPVDPQRTIAGAPRPLGSVVGRCHPLRFILRENAPGAARLAHSKSPSSWSRRSPQLHGQYPRHRPRTCRTRHALPRRLTPAAPSPGHHDHIVAHVSFRTWFHPLPRKDAAHPTGLRPCPQTSLWLHALKHAFPHQADGAVIRYWVERLYRLRNRVAHLEPLIDTNVLAYHRSAARLVRAIDPQLGDWLSGSSAVPHVLRKRPI